MTQKKGFLNFLQEFSIPLIAGVVVALVFANVDFEGYHHFVEWLPFGDVKFQSHAVDLHWLVNDIFMVFFFGIAAKEITESILPGGALNPMGKAVNPLLATVGGVLGPIAVFFGAVIVVNGFGGFGEVDLAHVHKGWGVPTATDIALAWLVARTVFGAGHPAVNFLLLLAVADDAIGLGIIAIFYGDPAHPAEPKFLLLVVLGMVVAWALRRMKVQKWYPYIFIAGPLSWYGLISAHLHPALALVFIVPFLPGPEHDTGLFVEEDEVDEEDRSDPGHAHGPHSPLHSFEHELKLFVDLGLFFFAFTNAGVELAGIGWMTWVILASLVIGKTVGITLFALIGRAVGFPLPERMGLKQLVMAGFVAALGLTVALFVCAQAFPDNAELMGEAKMGALFSGFVGLVAIPIGRMIKVRES